MTKPIEEHSSSKPRPIYVIAGHPFSGKTTFAQQHPHRVTDADDIYAKADKDKLKALRKAGDWAGSDALTDPLVREWAKSTAPGSILLTHGDHVMKLLPASTVFVGAVLVPMSVLHSRIEDYFTANDSPLPKKTQRVFMAGYSRKQLEDKAKALKWATFDSFDDAFQAIPSPISADGFAPLMSAITAQVQRNLE